MSSRGRPSGAGLGKTPRTRMLPVVGLTWLLTKLMVPWCGKPSSPLQAHEDRHLCAVLGRLDPPLVDRPADPQQGGLVHLEIGVHRVHRHDRGQERLVLVDQVAEGQVVAADLAVDRRRSPG